MEKVKISISGHDFYLKSEDPDRMYDAAENLQKKIDKLSSMASSMSLTDIAMLAALDFADENYDSRKIVVKAQQLSQEIQAKSAANEKRASELAEKLSASEAELAALKINVSESQSELSALKEQLSNINTEKSGELETENAKLNEQIKVLKAEKEMISESKVKIAGPPCVKIIFLFAVIAP